MKEDRHIITVLPPYIGEKYTLLLRALKYITIDDLAGAQEADISDIAGFGPVRLEQVQKALSDYGLAFQVIEPTDAKAGVAAVYKQLQKQFLTEPARPTTRRAQSRALYRGALVQ